LIAIGFRRKKLEDNKEYWIIENLNEETISNLTTGREIMLEKKTQIEVENDYANKRYEEEKRKIKKENKLLYCNLKKTGRILKKDKR